MILELPNLSLSLSLQSEGGHSKTEVWERGKFRMGKSDIVMLRVQCHTQGEGCDFSKSSANLLQNGCHWRDLSQVPATKVQLTSGCNHFAQTTLFPSCVGRSGVVFSGVLVSALVAMLR